MALHAAVAQAKVTFVDTTKIK